MDLPTSGPGVKGTAIVLRVPGTRWLQHRHLAKHCPFPWSQDTQNAAQRAHLFREQTQEGFPEASRRAAWGAQYSGQVLGTHPTDRSLGPPLAVLRLLPPPLGLGAALGSTLRTCNGQNHTWAS